MKSEVSALVAAWDPIHAKLAANNSHDAIRLRMHRSLSWLRRSAEFALPADSDAAFLFAWVAFNAMYANQKIVDKTAEEWQVRRDFIQSMLTGDGAQRVQEFLKSHRSICDRLLSEEHLHWFYWVDPSPEKMRQARSAPRRVGAGYHLPEECGNVLLPLIDRLSMLRAQLVHGQSTWCSSVNRVLVDPAAELMQGLMQTLLLTVVEDGLWDLSERWIGVPYPPKLPLHRR